MLAVNPGGRYMGDQEVVSAVVELTVPNGLHLTPISQIVSCASPFQASVTLGFDGKTADAKSIYDLMLLAAPCGAKLQVDARGTDAGPAIEAMKSLFCGGFIIAD